VPRQRPNPLRWLWYAVGGSLPERHRTWVLHDLTCRTWPLRHLLRACVQVAPVVVVLLLIVPGTLTIRIAAVTAGLLLGLFYSCAYMYEISEHRVAKAGYPVGTAKAVREEAHAEERAAERERYIQNWRRPEQTLPAAPASTNPDPGEQRELPEQREPHEQRERPDARR
jgi:hypothetical protein